jgi:hypothetical protein
MRISHNKKFIFISKPKCASSSVRSLLDPYSDIISANCYPYHHHTTAMQMKIHFAEMGWNWERYFKFITIRNPWDMIVSFYHYAKPDKNGIYFFESSRHGIKREEGTTVPFEDWLLDMGMMKSWHKLLYKNGEYLSNQWTADFSFYTLNNFILDETGGILVDYVIKVEDMEHGLKEVFDRLDIPHREIVRINQSQHKHYRSYYTEKTRRLVEKEFRYDILVGEYEF